MLLAVSSQLLSPCVQHNKISRPHEPAHELMGGSSKLSQLAGEVQMSRGRLCGGLASAACCCPVTMMMAAREDSMMAKKHATIRLRVTRYAPLQAPFQERGFLPEPL